MLRSKHHYITASVPDGVPLTLSIDLLFTGEKHMLTLDKIYHAAFVLKNVARKTDLIKATKLSESSHAVPETMRRALRWLRLITV